MIRAERIYVSVDEHCIDRESVENRFELYIFV